MSPALIDCQASFTRSRSGPGSSIAAIVASKPMPSFAGLLKVTVPTGRVVSWKSSSGSGIGEGDAERLDDVAAAIGLGRRRQPADAAAVRIEGLDVQQRIGAIHDRALVSSSGYEITYFKSLNCLPWRARRSSSGTVDAFPLCPQIGRIVLLGGQANMHIHGGVVGLEPRPPAPLGNHGIPPMM